MKAMEVSCMNSPSCSRPLSLEQLKEAAKELAAVRNNDVEAAALFAQQHIPSGPRGHCSAHDAQLVLA
jgi:hypothetical protein